MKARATLAQFFQMYGPARTAEFLAKVAELTTEYNNAASRAYWENNFLKPWADQAKGDRGYLTVEQIWWCAAVDAAAQSFGFNVNPEANLPTGSYEKAMKETGTILADFYENRYKKELAAAGITANPSGDTGGKLSTADTAGANFGVIGLAAAAGFMFMNLKKN